MKLLPTVEVLIKCGIEPTQAKLFSEPLSAACDRFNITTAARIAAFTSQCHVESQGFARLEENLWYTTPERIMKVWPLRVPSLSLASSLCRNPQALANRVYADRGGNGNEASGDGWRFRGRGLKQLTFRFNYANAARELGRPYVDEPDLVMQVPDACLTAAWFWNSINGNVLADSSQIDVITRAVNGPGMMAADTRRSMFDDAMRSLA